MIYLILAITVLAIPSSGQTNYIDALIQALNDTDWNVRANAATALGNIKDKKAADPPIHALQEKNQSVRRYASYAP